MKKFMLFVSLNGEKSEKIRILKNLARIALKNERLAINEEIFPHNGNILLHC